MKRSIRAPIAHGEMFRDAQGPEPEQLPCYAPIGQRTHRSRPSPMAGWRRWRLPGRLFVTCRLGVASERRSCFGCPLPGGVVVELHVPPAGGWPYRRRVLVGAGRRMLVIAPCGG